MMNDINHTVLLQGDTIKTERDGLLRVVRELAPDTNGSGALIECKSIAKGSRIDIRTKLSRAEVVRITGGRTR